MSRTNFRKLTFGTTGLALTVLGAITAQALTYRKQRDEYYRQYLATKSGVSDGERKLDVLKLRIDRLEQENKTKAEASEFRAAVIRDIRELCRDGETDIWKIYEKDERPDARLIQRSQIETYKLISKYIDERLGSKSTESEYSPSLSQ